MSEELKFQKLGEVDLLEEVPEGSHPLVEYNGNIVRVAKTLGGSLPVFDLTPFINASESGSVINTGMLEQGYLIITPSFSEQTVQDFMKLSSAGAILVHADLGDQLSTLLGVQITDGSYTIDQVFSTQCFDSGTALGSSMYGVCLYSGVTDLLAMNSLDIVSAVGVTNGVSQAVFVFPFLLQYFLG